MDEASYLPIIECGNKVSALYCIHIPFAFRNVLPTLLKIYLNTSTKIILFLVKSVSTLILGGSPEQRWIDSLVGLGCIRIFMKYMCVTYQKQLG